VSTPPSQQGQEAGPGVNLGLRLRVARQQSGQSLRELARRLGVSPSFLSQIENGKAQPSVATLYSMAQVLEVSIDHLFVDEKAEPIPEVASSVESAPSIPSVLQRAAAVREEVGEEEPKVNRSDLGSLTNVWTDGGNIGRLSVTSPGGRTRLVMDSGVIWEQLAANTAHQIDFIEITYPPGASSTSDERMLRHDGFEYGYLLEGELEVTLGFDVFTLHAGEALGLNSSVPHLFRNRGTVPAKGIWFVHHRHD
jgi:transcriptional regulator with XRE-family HTH domain/quercetin dioxygenase-like cupin family protein